MNVLSNIRSASILSPNRTRTLNRISKQEISPFKLNENFVNEIRNDEENINSEIFQKKLGIRIHQLQQKIYLKQIWLKIIKKEIKLFI